KINEIVSQAINHWTSTFGTKNKNTYDATIGLLNYINIINDFNTIAYFGDGKINNIRSQALNKVKSILTNIYNKGFDYWADKKFTNKFHNVFKLF
ncbi:6426_t:CDS:1, partial [Cetraspora pellucida]